MPSHLALYVWRLRQLTLVWGWMWWLKPYLPKMGLYARALQYRMLIQLHSGSKNVAVVVRNSMAYPQTLRKKTPVVRAVAATHISELPMQSVRQGPRPADAKAVCETKAGEIVWGAGFEWIGILSTWAGGFCPVSLGWIPWCLCLGGQQMWLYSFNQTCD